MAWDRQHSPPSEVVHRYSTSFIGRTEESAQLRTLLEETKGFVTLWGPAGIGKTRLADQLHREWTDRGEPALFCDLRTARNARDTCETVARALALHVSQTPAPTHLIDEIGVSLRAHGQCLVVLDNFEQLVDDALTPLLEWTQLAPKARFLVTSRRVLRLSGEQVYELGPLDLPDGASGSECSAIRLFVDRALNAEPTLHAEDMDLEDIAELVTLLEGRPLALELGAGLTRRQSVRDAVIQVKQSRLAMRNEDRDCDPRHTTLRAAIQSSWDLLTLAERTTAAQLTVFRESFSLEAAAAVVDLASDSGSSSIAELIEALREASVLRVLGGGHRRWSLYEATQEFAEQRRDVDATVEERHARYYASAARRWVEGLTTEDGLAVRETLSHERSNLEAAQVWFQANAPTHAPERAAIALALFAAHRERMPTKAAEMLDCALDSVDRASSEYTRLLIHRASALRDAGRPEAAQDALDIARKSASETPEREAEHTLEEGRLRFFEGDVQTARGLLERSVRLARIAGNAHQEGRAHTWLGWVLAEGFNDSQAFEHYGQAIALLEDSGDHYMLASVQGAQNCHRLFFQYPTTKADFERQLQLARRYGDRINETRGWLGLGIWSHERGELDQAREHFDAARRAAGGAGLRREEAIANYRLGTVYDELDDGANAIAFYQKGIALYQITGATRLAGIARALLGGRLAREGDTAGGTELIARSEAQSDDADLRRLAEIQRHRLRLAAARTAESRGSSKLAERLRRQSTKALAASGIAEETRDSEYDRFALRLWQRDLNDLASARPRLTVWPNGSAFQVGQRPRVSLASSPITRRVLGVLAEERSRTPGKPLSIDDILDAGWPDERIAPAAGTLRVQNAVKSLRRQGLRSILLTEGGSFFLDPAANLVEVTPKTA